MLSTHVIFCRIPDMLASSSSGFPYLSSALSFQSPRSPVLWLFYLYSFLFMYFLITSLHLRFGRPIFRCPPTSIFHVLITSTYFSVFSPRVLKTSQYRFSYFRTYICHTYPCSCFFIPDLPNPLYYHRSSQYSNFSSF